jgi:DNA-binding MarR family transcriptional regulator
MRQPAQNVHGEDDGTWTFLTNHAMALVILFRDPDLRVADLSEMLVVTERAAHRIVGDLVDGGYVRVAKHGRRNHYELVDDAPFRRRSMRDAPLEALIATVAAEASEIRAREQPAAHRGSRAALVT